MSWSLDKWPPRRINMTRDVLERVDTAAFCLGDERTSKGCVMQHLDGRFGYITINGAINYNFAIYNLDSDVVMDQYKNIDELIADGWAVSS